MIARIKSRLKHMCSYYETVQCYVVNFLLTPSIYIFEMTIVRPTVVDMYKMGDEKQILHVILPTFCFINVAGNMMMSIMTDIKLKIPATEGIYCEQCKITRPPKSWHCPTCNACILRRDHHCSFFSRCIGLQNQRYYILYLVYIFISMIYCSYYNYYFVSAKFEDGGLFMSLLCIMNPIVRVSIPEPMGVRDLYVLYFFLNGGLAVWSLCLATFHLRNVIRGVTTYEARHNVFPESSDWKKNLLNVFGEEWYLAILNPFVESPLPGESKKE